MANIAEVSEWTASVHELATTDPVEGGPDGISNAQAQALANRSLWLKDNTWRTGDIKEIDCSNAYIAANFNLTAGPTMGLGTNERLGWAICNGNNGTKNRNGRVGIGYGTSYLTMGATGGSENAVVVQHSHSGGSYHVGGGTPIFTSKGLVTGDDEVYPRTEVEGVSGVGKNMQPYIVSLFIMKL